MKSKLQKIDFPLPKEHGAYVVLFSSWILGLIRSHVLDIPRALLVLLFLISVFFLQALFAGRNNRSNIQLGSRIWLTAFALSSLGSGILLLRLELQLGYLAIPALIFGVSYQLMRPNRFGMGARSVVGFLLLTLAAPFTQNALGNPTFTLLADTWFIAAAYFCGSAMNIRLRLAKSNKGRGRTLLVQSCIYHSLVLLISILLASLGHIGWETTAGISLSTLRLLWIIRNLDRFENLPLKRIGVQESVLAALFLAMNASF